MSEGKVIEIGEVVRMLWAIQPGELIMVFPPGEIAEAKEIGAAGHAVAVIPKDLWDRIPNGRPGNRVVITDCGHLLGLLEEKFANQQAAR